MSKSRRILLTAGLILAIVAPWAWTAWVAQGFQKAQISRTNWAFGASLLVTYVSLWALHVVWARGSRRRAVFRAILATMVLAICLGCLEVPAALGKIHYRRFWDALTGNWRGPESEFVSDPELAWRRVPGLRLTGRPQGDIAQSWNIPLRPERPLEFTFNAKGFRGPESARCDVALVGDSYVEGHLVSDDETCSVQLARLTDLTVGNFGQSGYGTAQELRVLELEALAQKPRTIVWFFYEGNDLYDDQEFENNQESLARDGQDGSKKQKPLTSKWKFKGASFTVNAFLALRRLAHPLVPNQMPYFGWFKDDQGRRVRVFFHDDCVYPLGDYELTLFEKTKSAFRKGRDLCAQHGVNLQVGFIPTKFRVYGETCEFPAGSACKKWKPWKLEGLFREFCESEKIAFIDLTGPLKEAARAGKLLYAPADTHWNPAGHAFVAQVVAGKTSIPARSAGGTGN
jgi:acetyltransferase AlgX (SGNH hydrolase-like protein)